MASASSTERVQAPIEVMYRVITEYETYPKFLPMCKSIKVDRKGDGAIEVAYALDLFTNVLYTTVQKEDPATHSLSWTLKDSNVFKKNDGGWKLKAISPTVTEARYELDLEFKVPVPGFVLKKLVQVSLPDMMKSFIKRAELEAKKKT